MLLPSINRMHFHYARKAGKEKTSLKFVLPGDCHYSQSLLLNSRSAGRTPEPLGLLWYTRAQHSTTFKEYLLLTFHENIKRSGFVLK